VVIFLEVLDIKGAWEEIFTIPSNIIENQKTVDNLNRNSEKILKISH
jgi:hypothetical protein